MSGSGHFRGSGGTVWELDLPLGENYQRQVDRGELVRVNPDGSPHEAHSSLDAVGGEYRRPGANAPKSEWVAYAVSQGMKVDDADAATKQDLIERFGAK